MITIAPNDPNLKATITVDIPGGQAVITWNRDGFTITGAPDGGDSHERHLAKDTPLASALRAALGDLATVLAMTSVLVPSRPVGS